MWKVNKIYIYTHRCERESSRFSPFYHFIHFACHLHCVQNNIINKYISVNILLSGSNYVSTIVHISACVCLFFISNRYKKEKKNQKRWHKKNTKTNKHMNFLISEQNSAARLRFI